MKIIQSFWSKPAFHNNQNFTNSRGFGGWLNYRYFLLSTCFSCLSIQKHHKDITLYTDDQGYDLFINSLKLPYKEVSLKLNSLINEDHKLWTLGKLLAIKEQEMPFIHVDNDVFIWQQLPSSRNQEFLITQSKFPMWQEYRSSLNEIYSNFKYIPECMLERPSEKTMVANVGVIGGNNISLFQEFCEISSDLLHRNKEKLPFINIGGFNQMMEEYLFTCLTRFKKLSVQFLFESIDPVYHLRINLVPVWLKYIHLIGQYKQNQYACEQIELRLRYEFPSYYKLVQELINEKYPELKDDSSLKVSREQKLLNAINIFYTNDLQKIMKMKIRITPGYEIIAVQDYLNPNQQGYVVKQTDSVTRTVNYKYLPTFSNTDVNYFVTLFSTPVTMMEVLEEIHAGIQDVQKFEEIKLQLIDIVTRNLICTGILEFN